VIGTRINNYEIVSLIGEGGMGNVYLARHPLLDRGAAIKVLHEDLSRDRLQVMRFFNEARAANAIRHPNIIDIIDVGSLPGSQRPYLMMELLQGESLARRLTRVGRLAIATAIDVARQTASALAAAHARGIVHRDLKPDNLFLVPHASLPGRELVKVLDFGIAKLRGDVDGARVQTQTGLLMGTPPYMSPEQCQGVSAQIDHRSDIYALGILLFEMVCGAPPFQAEGFGDLLVMHLTRPPPPARSRNPAVPRVLDAIIQKALAKDPPERFTSMADLEAALAAVPAPAADAPAPLPRVDRPGPEARPTTGASRELEAFGEVSPDVEDRHRPRSRRSLVLGSLGMATLAVGGYLGLTRARQDRDDQLVPATAAPQSQAATTTQPVLASPSPPAADRPDAGPAAQKTRRPARKAALPRTGPEKW
jgi:eukaryotic-like serine/threonine-protein kinase